MKKVVLLGLAALFLVTLAGCSSGKPRRSLQGGEIPAAASTQTPAATAESTPAPTPTTKPFVTIVYGEMTFSAPSEWSMRQDGDNYHFAIGGGQLLVARMLDGYSNDNTSLSELYDVFLYAVQHTDDFDSMVMYENIFIDDRQSMHAQFYVTSSGGKKFIDAYYISAGRYMYMFWFGGIDELPGEIADNVQPVLDSIVISTQPTPTVAPTVRPTPSPTPAGTIRPTAVSMPVPTLVPTAAPTSLSTVAPTAAPTLVQNAAPVTGTPTTGQRNALRSAKSYLDFSAFSYKGLIKQLEYEGFTHDEATYGADMCVADWNEQALRSAKSYLDFTAFSYKGLIKQLEHEEFTSSEATYGADMCGADWNEQAMFSAKAYLDFSSFSRDDLIKQLEYEGFTHDQAVYGVTQNGF